MISKGTLAATAMCPKSLVCRFQLKPEMGFTAGQQAYSDFFELTMEEARILHLQDTAVQHGMSCHKIHQGLLNICYVMCTQYNYWEGCTNHPGKALSTLPYI